MVELTQGEIIQIFRKRAGINQGQLGADAFNTTPDSGRTKVKNIELNKQKPTIDDIKAIAESLNVPLADLLSYPAQQQDTSTAHPSSEGVFVHRRIFNHFNGLEECLSILNKALILDDKELIFYVAKKAAGILQQASKGAESLQSI
jgi:transcriptional regulator with XRE-family HTH domain